MDSTIINAKVEDELHIKLSFGTRQKLGSILLTCDQCPLQKPNPIEDTLPLMSLPPENILDQTKFSRTPQSFKFNEDDSSGQQMMIQQLKQTLQNQNRTLKRYQGMEHNLMLKDQAIQKMQSNEQRWENGKKQLEIQLENQQNIVKKKDEEIVRLRKKIRDHEQEIQGDRAEIATQREKEKDFHIELANVKSELLKHYQDEFESLLAQFQSSNVVYVQQKPPAEAHNKYTQTDDHIAELAEEEEAGIFDYSGANKQEQLVDEKNQYKNELMVKKQELCIILDQMDQIQKELKDSKNSLALSEEQNKQLKQSLQRTNTGNMSNSEKETVIQELAMENSQLKADVQAKKKEIVLLCDQLVLLTEKTSSANPDSPENLRKEMKELRSQLKDSWQDLFAKDQEIQQLHVQVQQFKDQQAQKQSKNSTSNHKFSNEIVTTDIVHQILSEVNELPLISELHERLDELENERNRSTVTGKTFGIIECLSKISQILKQIIQAGSQAGHPVTTASLKSNPYLLTSIIRLISSAAGAVGSNISCSVVLANEDFTLLKYQWLNMLKAATSQWGHGAYSIVEKYGIQVGQLKGTMMNYLEVLVGLLLFVIDLDDYQNYF